MPKADHNDILRRPALPKSPVKEIIVLVQRSPFNTLRNSEGLRMSVGLTLEEGNKVTVVFLKDGVYLLGHINVERIQTSPVYKHLEALKALGHRMVAEKESLEERGLKELRVKAEVVPRTEVIKMITKADAVIPWQ